MGVPCVPTSWNNTAKVAELAQLRGRSNSTAVVQELNFMSASFKDCNNHGLGVGGVIFRIGDNEVRLGCITDANAI